MRHDKKFVQTYFYTKVVERIHTVLSVGLILIQSTVPEEFGDVYILYKIYIYMLHINQIVLCIIFTCIIYSYILQSKY